MCGDLDDVEDEFLKSCSAFLQAAEAAVHEARDHRGGSRHIDARNRESADECLSDASLHRYMDGLFADVLSACIKDARRMENGDQYRLARSQVVVLARVAGFVAGNLDPRDDVLANAVEALMTGYSQRGGSTHHA